MSTGKHKKTSEKRNKSASSKKESVTVDEIEAEDNTSIFSPIYRKMTIEETVRLTPEELSNGNINNTCMYHLKRKIGNKCINEGYVVANTITILERSPGMINTRFLDGSVNYKLIFSADICCPRPGDILPATFVDINPAGILAEIKGSPLNIVLPKILHGPNEQEVYARIDLPDSEDHTKTLAIQIRGAQIRQNTRIIKVIGKVIGILD
jgi:DNA-directed RNA polymerase subunit E'/Rpb7